jgi:hypothetical protein
MSLANLIAFPGREGKCVDTPAAIAAAIAAVFNLFLRVRTY